MKGCGNFIFCLCFRSVLQFVAHVHSPIRYRLFFCQGATAEVGFKINSKKDIICYDIKTFGVKGEWYNPGRTATHLGYPTGPSAYPRITFPNPTAVNSNEPDGEKVSKGCLKGPFATGRVEKGVDSGSESGL